MDMVNRMSAYRKNTCKNQRRLYKSLIDFGFDSHEVKHLHELPTDVSNEVVNNYERLYIKFYKDAGCEMLNLTDGGVSNYAHSEETKKKMSKNRSAAGNEKLKGRKRSKEFSEKISRAHKGLPKNNTPEKKKAFVELMRQYANSPKRIAGISNANKNSKRSDESRLKMSIAQKKRYAH